MSIATSEGGKACNPGAPAGSSRIRGALLLSSRARASPSSGVRRSPRTMSRSSWRHCCSSTTAAAKNVATAEWLPQVATCATRKALPCRAFRCAEETRASTQLAWTRPSTWLPGRHIRPNRPRSSASSRNADDTDASDDPDVATRPRGAHDPGRLPRRSTRAKPRGGLARQRHGVARRIRPPDGAGRRVSSSASAGSDPHGDRPGGRILGVGVRVRADRAVGKPAEVRGAFAVRP